LVCVGCLCARAFGVIYLDFARRRDLELCGGFWELFAYERFQRCTRMPVRRCMLACNPSNALPLFVPSCCCAASL
jgi:hypothetical protein